MNSAMSDSPASQPTRFPRDTNTSPPEYQFIVYTLLLILAVLAMPTLMFCRRCPNFTKIFIFKNFLQEVEIIVEAEATIDTEANYANAEALAGEQSIDGTTDIVGEVVARKSRQSVQADGVQAYCVTVMGTTPGPSVPLDRYELKMPFSPFIYINLVFCRRSTHTEIAELLFFELTRLIRSVGMPLFYQR
jgi:hypothetical protein